MPPPEYIKPYRGLLTITKMDDYSVLEASVTVPTLSPAASVPAQAASRSRRSRPTACSTRLGNRSGRNCRLLSRTARRTSGRCGRDRDARVPRGGFGSPHQGRRWNKNQQRRLQGGQGHHERVHLRTFRGNPRCAPEASRAAGSVHQRFRDAQGRGPQRRRFLSSYW